MNLDNMRKKAIQEVSTYYRPEVGSEVYGHYKGVQSRMYLNESREYWVLETENGHVLVPQYGYLKKHWPAELQIDDYIYIKCVRKAEMKGNKAGYIFALSYVAKDSDQDVPF